MKSGISTKLQDSRKWIFKEKRMVKLWNLGKLGTIVGVAQVLVQGIGFISGILVIRLLPTNEYALYTLANTLLGAMTVLADGGISKGLMSQGGKVWHDRGKLGVVLVTGMNLRRKFSIISLILSIPALLYLLNRHGASWLMSILISLSLILPLYTTVSGKLLEIPPKLHQNIHQLQRIQIEYNAGRLFLIGLTIFIFPFAGIAILCSGIAQLYANLRLRKLVHCYADKSQGENNEVKHEILRIVKRILPGSIYFCLSGQISIWLVSIFGNVESIAQMGALARLSMILGVVGVVVQTLLTPRYARLPNKRKLLISRLILMLLMISSIGFSIILTVWTFPSQALWILGENYTHLTEEVVLMAVASCLGLLANGTYDLTASRGIVIPPAISIPILISVQITLILLLDVTTLKGVLNYSILFILCALCIRLIYITHYFMRADYT